MKKLGKSFSFLTKIMLVIGLLISNLSSLSVVFAYEATGAIEITVVDEKLNIKYLEELAEEVENVNVNVYENYTYLDDSSYYVDEFATESGKVSNYSLTSEEFMVSEGIVFESILSNIVFDGLYEVKVEITDTNDEVIDSAVYSENIEHESGLTFKLFDEVGNEITASENGVYPVMQDNSKIKVVAQILAGGLKPTEMFSYEDEDFMAADLLALEFSSELEFNGRLYGEYALPVEVKILNSNLEEVVYTDNVTVLYESYAKNNELLNNVTVSLGIDEAYEFNGVSKDGILNILLNSNENNTVLDLYNLMNLVFGENDIVSYVISNSDYEDVLATYDETTLGVSLEDYLDTILLNDSTVLSIMNDGLTVTYSVVVVGDTNNDNALTEEDLLGLVDQVIDLEEKDMSKSDLNSDGEVNTLDVMYLDQVMKSAIWEVSLEEVEATIDAGLVLNATDIVSGDEFTIDYVLSVKDYAVNGISGLFNYDETMLELVSVEVANEWVGNINDGKFLYLGSESLTATEVNDENGEVIVEPVEYVVLTATFRSLKSGESTVTIDSPEYFDQTKYLVVDSEIEPVTVVVNASDNNNLSCLTVAGQVIELVEEVLDYEITVSNDVTVADVEAIVENVAASVTSIVAPEELVEGENTITVTVTSESGNVKVYTIIVNREATPEEETTTTQMNYTNNYSENSNVESNEEEVIVESEEEESEEEEVIEEESNLSRIIIIILILLVIAGLIYLIFKDEYDEETKKTNKEINKLKKEKEEVEVKVEKTPEKSINNSTNRSTNKSNNNRSNNKNKRPNNRK